MIAYVVPNEQKETFTLTGTGSHVLTEAQRSARVLTVLAEKVLLNPPPQYFNFIYPEPKSFWGYCQWVYRDYINQTLDLEYRRQVLMSSDWIEAERNRQLLCLVGRSQELAYIRLLDLLALTGVPQEDRAVLYENWKTETAIQFLAQVRPETALWYEVTPGFGLQITVIWRPHWEACKPGEPPVFLPPPRGTAKDEQRPNDGGGGQQPFSPPPVGRRGDPLSDSPAPPPDSTGGPPSPVPAPPPPNPNQRFSWSAKPSESSIPLTGSGYAPITYATFTAFSGTSSGMRVSYRASIGGPILTQDTNVVPNSQYSPSLIVSPIP